MRKTWTDEAWEEYVHWQTVDKKTLKRIHAVLNDIDCDPFSGIGKPKPLRHDKHGYWSRALMQSTGLYIKSQTAKWLSSNAVRIMMIKPLPQESA